MLQQQENSLLCQAVRRNDAQEFLAILEKRSWPEGWYSDYELLVMAINLCHQPIVNVLLQKGCRVAKDGCKAKAFHGVVKLDWVDVAYKFLERGARVYDQDFELNTAIHVAFFHRASDAMMELLLERFFKETSLNIMNINGISVWHIMCAGPKSAFVKDALDCGFADINSRVPLNLQKYPAYAGYTALHFAVQFNRHEIAKLLLENNANIYARDATGSTPLHVACKFRNVQMIDLIFSYDKSNDNVINNYGLSLFMVACVGNDVSVVKDFLKTADSQPWTCPKVLVTSRVNETCYHPFAGYSPLHFAAEFGRYDTVNLLLSYESPCCLINAAKLTPLELANKGQHQNVLTTLLRYCLNNRKKLQRQDDVNKLNRTLTYPKIESDNDGYQVPDAWFLRKSLPREYPRYVTVHGHFGRKHIPLYAPKPGTKYLIAAKLFSGEPYIRTYYSL